MTANYEPLLKQIGYIFQDEKLLDLALTHRSAGGRNNERLEFLGDAILNFTIAGALFQQFPRADEGELSRKRAYLVKKESLAKLGNEIELGSYLKLGSGEMKSGGFRRSSILANTVEAILGAIYLDSGYESCRAIILSLYESALAGVDDIRDKDSKTRLQEYLQGKQLPLPLYEVVQIDGDAHEQVFYVACQVDGLDEPVTGKGQSRRKAEQASAEKALKHLGIFESML